MTAPALKEQISKAISFAQKQVRELIETYPGFYPLYTHKGKWKHDLPAWTHWCDGFLPGMMWLFLESGQADDPASWRAMAEKYSTDLEDSSSITAPTNDGSTPPSAKASRLRS